VAIATSDPKLHAALTAALAKVRPRCPMCFAGYRLAAEARFYPNSGVVVFAGFLDSEITRMRSGVRPVGQCGTHRTRDARL
jgi:hypothetical protein